MEALASIFYLEAVVAFAGILLQSSLKACKQEDFGPEGVKCR